MPDKVQSPVGKTQIHYEDQKAEADLMSHGNACPLREHEEQRKQDRRDNTAVDICHTVADVGVCRNHKSSEEIEKIILKRKILGE